MNNVIHNKLTQFGFTSNEADVYLTLVTHGKMKAATVINETKLQRSAVYGALDALVERNFVSKVLVGGVAVFSASDPLQFVLEVDQKRASATELAELVERKHVHGSREVHTLEGITSLQRATMELLTVGGGDTIYFLGSSKEGNLSEMERFWQRFHKKRAELSIATKILYDRSTNERIIEQRNTLAKSQAKYMPFGESLPLAFTVRGDRTIITTIDDVDPLVFTVRSEALAHGIREYFEFLWEQY